MGQRGHHTPRPLLDQTSATPPPRRAPGTGAGGTAVVATGHCGAIGEPQMGSARRSRLRGQLALLFCRYQLRRVVLSTKPPPTFLVSGHRGTVLPPVSTSGDRAVARRRAPPAGDRRLRSHHSVCPSGVRAGRRLRPHLLRHRHPGRRASDRCIACLVVVEPVAPGPGLPRAGRERKRPIPDGRHRRYRRPRRYVLVLGGSDQHFSCTGARRPACLCAADSRDNLRGQPTRMGGPLPVTATAALDRPHILRPLSLPLARFPHTRRSPPGLVRRSTFRAPDGRHNPDCGHFLSPARDADPPRPGLQDRSCSPAGGAGRCARGRNLRNPGHPEPAPEHHSLRGCPPRGLSDGNEDRTRAERRRPCPGDRFGFNRTDCADPGRFGHGRCLARAARGLRGGRSH